MSLTVFDFINLIHENMLWSCKQVKVGNDQEIIVFRTKYQTTIEKHDSYYITIASFTVLDHTSCPIVP